MLPLNIKGQTVFTFIKILLLRKDKCRYFYSKKTNSFLIYHAITSDLQVLLDFYNHLSHHKILSKVYCLK